jgi:hypothetical protein
MHSRATCPTCGMAAFTNLGEEDIEGAPDMDSASYVAVPVKMVQKAKKKKITEKKKTTPDTSYSANELSLFVSGATAVCFGGRELPAMQRKIKPGRILPPIQRSGHHFSIDIAQAAESSHLLCIQGLTSTLPVSSSIKSLRKKSVLEGRKSFGLPPVLKSVQHSQATSESEAFQVKGHSADLRQ